MNVLRWIVMLFGFGCVALIWGWIGCKKAIYDWKKEFGSVDWGLVGLEFMIGLIPLAIGIFWLFVIIGKINF